jgi:DNA-binding NtrC family response regulator
MEVGDMVSARKLTLMIVDDDPSIVRLLRHVLQQRFADQVDVHVETSARSAMTWLDEHCCDLLISDIEMPGTDGLEILRHAKFRNAWTQVVFITGHSSLDRINEAVESGASDYLLKPIDREELIDVVSQLCRRCARWQSALLSTFGAAK